MQQNLVREKRGGEVYEYYPLGKHIVVAPGVCGGKPTFKRTQIRVAFVLDLLAAGWTIEQVTRKYQSSHLSAAAIKEAIQLAKKAFVKTSPVLRMAT
jgi:uncharacterized protein (DUF433 family)